MIAWRHWKISTIPGESIRCWDESIDRRPNSCCTSAINCSASCGRRAEGKPSPPARLHPLASERRARELNRPTAPGEAVRRGLLAAFPDRLVRRSGPGSRFGRMVGGRGVRVVESSAVRNAPLFLAVDVDRGGSEALVRQASAVERDWLPADRLVTRTEVEFDAASRRVIARRRVYWEDLLLEESPASLPDGDEVAAILAAAAAQSLDEVFPWDDAETADFVNRVRCLAQWMPELELPAFDAAGLQAVLPRVCHGCRSLDELRKAPWLAHLQAALTPEQQRALAREAPERIEVPSGSRIKLHYEPGKPPVLAVRIQEIFGMLETPRVAGRRVPVLMHLLAPNHRPQQVTDDLASFWRTTYHQVRKDLRRRYPKHAWPEDPYQATAEKKTGKEGTMNPDTFNQLVDVYEAMIDWPKRLAAEEPFYRRWFQQAGVKRVVDVACGTGHHAAMFHGWGLDVEGADLSPAMIERARAGFGEAGGIALGRARFRRADSRTPGRGMRLSAWETPWPWRPTWRRFERPSPG